MALEGGYTRPGFIDWKAQRKLTTELLSRLNVEMDLTVPMRECRAVDRSAVAIARALRPSRDPVKLVVLDEPTASLPDAEVRHLFELIRELTASGVAVMYVTHRLEEVFEIADQVTVLRDGRHRGTRPIGELSRESLVELIVGKELASDYATAVEVESEQAVSGDVALGVRGLSGRRLGGIDFELRHGEVLGVTGLAGSGYDELARALVGGVLEQTGEVEVDGVPIVPLVPDVARAAGLVLALSNTQAGSAIPQFCLRENITLPSLGRFARRGRLARRPEREEATEWIASLDVRPPEPERLYNQLSGGNQQKVILAKWLSAAPKVLVLDEPTAGVDVGSRHAIYELIAREAARGLAVLICSSDQEDLIGVCQSALVIRNGAIARHLHGTEMTEESLLLAAASDAPAGVSA
jgi:ribose transport system ATP-binding protein